MVSRCLCTIQVSNKKALYRHLLRLLHTGLLLPCSEVASFSELARDLIMQLPYAVPLPDDGSVFDYFLDLKIYHFLPWEERKSENRKSSNHSGYIALPEVCDE